MAAAAHVTANVYGMVQGAPPYVGAEPFARQINFPTPAVMSFPTAGTVFTPTSQGIRFGNNYVYSIIEVAPTGLNVHGAKYAAGESVATLATAAG
ncbi:MAG: hypothetical protein KBD02_04840 [Bacteroides sp.]|nr:hypothetical protein [Bacteroides sp.]